MRPIFYVLPFVFVIAACSPRGLTLEDLPTVVPSVDDLATATALTEQAPPEGYRENVAYPIIDQNLRSLDGWRYEVLLSFDGVFTQVNRPTSGEVSAEVWFNPIANARRVIVSTDGELFQRDEGEAFEAVALGDEAFLVRDGACLANVQEDARTAAAISAGALLGGVEQATPTGRSQMVNGVQAWEYTFALEAMNIPALRFAGDTRIPQMRGELWVSPEHDAVVRYWVTLDVENGRLLLNDLPVTGELRLRFDLYDVNVQPNITVPFGC